jgi:GT2 family glycosyltransferase
MIEKISKNWNDTHVLPVLSIVIVNSDGTQDTLNCLTSIYTYPPEVPFEVILVDNCSKESCIPVVNEIFPQVITLSSKQRQGFSINYNFGIRKSSGDYILILNNDTLVHHDTFNALIHAIKCNPSYAMVGPKLLNTNGSIQTSCARSLRTPFQYIMNQFLLDLALPTGKLWDSYLRSRIKKRTTGPVQCISGACMLVSRKLINQVGLLDEGYDFYYEDIEWCHRVQKHGLIVAYIPEAMVTHLGDQSLSKVKVWAMRSGYRSAIRYFKHYHDLSVIGHWMIWLATMLGYLLRALAYLLIELFTRQKKHARAYIDLSRWIIHQSPIKSTNEENG